MNEYIVKKGIPLPSGAKSGLSTTIRGMSYGDCIAIPAEQHVSAHTCARSVGAKVRTRSNKDGTVNVWRIDQDPAAGLSPAAESSPSNESLRPASLKTIFD